MAMEVLISDSRTETLFTERNSLIKFDESRIREVIAEGSLDFDEWTSLISDIEKLFPGDIDKISLVYDSFLVEYPLCFAYWRKYAHHKTCLCTVDKAVEVFERAVQSATYSVDVWLDYCSFSISVFEDPSDIRRLFKRGISFVGKDYMCHTLWDKYIAFEFSQQQWSSLAHIYIQTMRSPSRKLHHYHESFKKLATAWKEELEREGVSPIEFQLESIRGSEVSTNYKDGEICSIINDLLDPSLGLARSKALQKYLFHGERIYEEACELHGRIHCFETRIRRRYFHVKPLDSSQLENWHDYLSFAEKHGDFEWAVKLYERCLIPCANYPEFWMRYVDYLESKGAREIANLALARATQSFLKRVPVIHLLNARYKEQIGDIQMACTSFLQCDTGSDSSFVESINMKANMEKRLGNFVAACNTYKEALESAAQKDKLHCLPILYVHFSRLKYMITESADAARDILVDGIKQVPCCKLLLEELIKFAMMHGGPRHIDILDSVIANALYSAPGAVQGFTEEDVEDISSLYLQFLDLCGTIHNVRKAWARHIKFFPNSMRTAYNHPTRVANPLKADMEIRQDRIVALPSHPSESDHLLQTPSKNKKLSPAGNDSYHSDQAIITVKSNQKSSLSKDDDAQFDNGKFDNPHLEDDDDRVQERTQPSSHVVDEQRMEDVCEPSKSSFDLENQDAKETVATKASDKLSKEEDTQHESDHESKHDLKPPSVERLSLDHQDKKPPPPVSATSHECESREDTNFSQEASMSDRSMLVEGAQNNHINHFVSSGMDTQASGSVQIQTGFVSPSSSASHPNIETDAPARLQMPANSGRNCHQRHNTNKNHRDSRLRSREHSHRRPHHRRRVSPQRYPQLGTGTQMPVTPGYPPPQPFSAQNPQMLQTQNQYPASANFTASQVWPMQNIQHSNEQQNVIQNNEAYNHQMWQYYYYQQQQLYLQQQQLQPQQQQLLQQQYQQQQQPYFQQQQHILPHQEQHQLLQEQQYQQMVQQHHLYQQQQQQQVPPQQEQQLPEEQQPELE